MNKDRIRKYLIATIAMMLTFAVVYVVFGMNKNDAYASTTGTLKWDVTVTPDIKVNGTTDSTITPTSCSYGYEVKKTDGTGIDATGTSTRSRITGNKANVDIDASYKIVLTSCSVTIDGTTYNATGTCETELTGTGESDRTGTLTPEINLTRGTLKWNVTVTPDIKVNGTTDSTITPTSCSYGYEVKKTDGTGIDATGTSTNSPITGNKTAVDTNASYKFVLTSCSVTIEGTTYTASTPIETNLSGTGEDERTGTLSPEINITRGTLSWSVTVTPAVQVNGQDKTPTSCSYEYEVKKTDGSSIYTGTASSSPITESKDNVDTNAAYKLVLKSCNVTVDAKSYTVTLTNETNLTGTGTATRTGTISPVINLTTKPSSYGSKLKSASVKNEDEDYIEVSKIEDSLRNDILDYVYDNNVNNLKSVIQGIMSRGNELSLKVVAEKIDSSDADGKSDLKDEARKPSDVASKAEMLNYYNISIYITEGNSYHYDRSWNVTDTGSNNKLTLTFKVKSDSTSGKRYYKVLRYHGGDAESLTDYSTSTSIKTKSHKFSTYAVSYYDSSSSSSSSASTPKSNSAIVPGDDGTGAGGTDKSKTPKTGDDFNPRIWIYLLIVCATVASAAWILLQDTKDEKKDKG